MIDYYLGGGSERVEPDFIKALAKVRLEMAAEDKNFLEKGE